MGNLWARCGHEGGYPNTPRRCNASLTPTPGRLGKHDHPPHFLRHPQLALVRAERHRRLRRGQRRRDHRQHRVRRCPRCERPLPQPPEWPAGSRITACRSIPICGRCGSDEVYEQLDGAQGYGWGLSSAGCWPIPVDEIDERRARYQQQAKPAILTADGHLVTKDGSTPVTNPCNTGGWAQYGTAEED